MKKMEGLEKAFKEAKEVFLTTFDEDGDENSRATTNFNEDPEVVKEKWKWWYLSWRPTQRRRFWFPPTLDDPKRVIINIHPKSVKAVDATK